MGRWSGRRARRRGRGRMMRTVLGASSVTRNVSQVAPHDTRFRLRSMFLVWFLQVTRRHCAEMTPSRDPIMTRSKNKTPGWAPTSHSEQSQGPWARFYPQPVSHWSHQSHKSRPLESRESLVQSRERCDNHGDVCNFSGNPHRQLGPALKVVSIIVLSVFDLLPLLLAHLFTRSMLFTAGLRSNAG